MNAISREEKEEKKSKIELRESISEAAFFEGRSKMATLQKTRPAASTTSATSTGSWTDFFPAEVGQQQSSTTFVRKLVAVGVSQILYLRTEIPDEAFDSVDLDGLPLKMIKGSHDQSKKICALLSNALNGVKRK